METNTVFASERLPTVNALFWGLLIVFIDINLGDFDIVSDLLGLLIVTIALFRLRPYSKRFRQGFFCSLSALSFQVFDTLRLFPSDRTQPVLSGVFYVMGLLLSILVLFLILSGLAQLAERQQLPSLGERLRHSFIFYCITTLLTLAFSGITVLAIAVLIFCFVFYIMILRGIRSAYRSLSSAMLQPDEPEKPGAGCRKNLLL